ncbi:hypothetical protein D1AOALGA4SA_12045 [Olavius algarvensis Delta 1 endosymbiont]|nr:hypothetical protein D1AOALGA4SA_12045 [Olavius algarvensis Delta 1 endosymbiont]
MKVATFTSSVQVSGVRCQQPKSTFWMGIVHDFFSPLLTFSLNPFRVQNSGFFFTDT